MSEDELVHNIYRLLLSHPSGILSDIDGTLSRIVEDPRSAFVDPDIKDALHQLASSVEVIGVVTGRAAQDAERMLGLDGIVYLGNHGMERLEGGRVTVAPEALDSVAAISRVLETAQRSIDDPGVIFENKGLTGSIHYRGVANPTAARDEILSIVTPMADAANLRLSHGRMVIELRPPVALNKGTALRQIVAEHALHSIVFLGDDVTDIDAMSALAELRNAGSVQGLSIGVTDSESPPEIREFADVLVDGVDGVRRILTELAARFRGR